MQSPSNMVQRNLEYAPVIVKFQVTQKLVKAPIRLNLASTALDTICLDCA